MGTECKPLTGSGMARLMFAGGQRDLSAEPVPGATLDDLDPAQIERLRRTIHTEGASGRLAELASKDLVAALGLVRDGAVTMAAILLFGTPTAIDRWAGQHEVVFLRFRDPTRPDVRHDLREPLLATLARLEDLLTAHSRIESIEQPLFREIEIPDLSWWVAREAVLNALVHRDYFLRQSVYVELRPGRVEITSPGGFVGGVSASNVLRHPPVRRNPLLAEVLQTAGLVNRAGLGVDRIFEELLALGKSMPRYEADEAHVRLTLPTRTHRPFAQFVAEQRQQGRPLGLDDLILLRTVTERGSIDRWSAAQQLQLPEDEAASRLAELRRRGHFVAHGRGRGTAYRLTRKLSDRLRGPDVTDQELALDGEAVRLRLQAVLAERGSLTNADVRRISGYSRGEAVRLMRQLRDAGLAVLQGRGRGAHYRPGPALKQ